jgi:hypothetical protein
MSSVISRHMVSCSIKRQPPELKLLSRNSRGRVPLMAIEHDVVTSPISMLPLSRLPLSVVCVGANGAKPKFRRKACHKNMERLALHWYRVGSHRLASRCTSLIQGPGNTCKNGASLMLHQFEFSGSSSG